MRFETVVSVIMVMVALGAMWWFRPEPSEPAGVPKPQLSSSTSAAAIVVHVSGAVEDPGLVRLAVGARVADAISEAGGTTDDADLGLVNLAAVVVDGQQVVVPSEGSLAQPTASDGRIRVNSATALDLEELPGVGPVLAQRILDHRTTVGGFTAVEDLLDVPGIGEATLARLREHIVIP